MLYVELPHSATETLFLPTHANMQTRHSSASKTKKNLRRHSAQLHRGIPTSNQLNVCCAYCENYGKAMSKHKHDEINNWRNDVNKALSPAPKSRVKPRIKYMYDSHEDLRVQSQKQNGEHFPKTGAPLRSTSVSAISLHLAEMALNAPGMEPHHKSKSYNHKRMLSASRSSFTSYLSRNSGENMFSHTYNDPLRRSRMSHSADTPRMRARSSSNELLNVMTIDDCHRIHNHRPHIRSRSSSHDDESDWHSYTANGHVNGGTATNNDKDENQDSKSKADVSVHESNMSEINSKSNNFADDLLHEPNYPVLNALDNMISSREVIHNDAHRGLFKHDSSQKAKLAVKKESKRFKRLNDQLHRHIEAEILTKNYRLRSHNKSINSSIEAFSNAENDEKLFLAIPGHNNLSLRSSLRTPGELTARTNKKRVKLQLPSSGEDDKQNCEKIVEESTENQSDKHKESFLQTLLDMEGGDTETLETSSVQAGN